LTLHFEAHRDLLFERKEFVKTTKSWILSYSHLSPPFSRHRDHTLCLKEPEASLLETFENVYDYTRQFSFMVMRYIWANTVLCSV
jgi:hypothetical protein